MTGNFDIRDSNWDSLFLFYSAHNDLLINIADTFDLSFSHSTNSVPTRYSDNDNNSNSVNDSVIDLIFLKSNSLEFNSHTILPEFQYLSNHALLVVDIYITEKFV